MSQENGRLQEKLHSYRKEVRQLEASRHARSDEVQVLQAQLRSVHTFACNAPSSLQEKACLLSTRHAYSQAAPLLLMTSMFRLFFTYAQLVQMALAHLLS